MSATPYAKLCMQIYLIHRIRGSLSKSAKNSLLVDNPIRIGSSSILEGIKKCVANFDAVNRFNTLS